MLISAGNRVASGESADEALPGQPVLLKPPAVGLPSDPSQYRQYSAHERGALFPRSHHQPPSNEEIVLPMHMADCGPLGGYPAPEPFWRPFTYWRNRLFRHSDPSDPMRHMGYGIPLHGTSWRNRPLYAGWLVGGVWGDRLTAAVDQSEELFGGYRFGWDFDHYFGTELRFAWANVDLIGIPPPGAQSAGHLYYDINLLYYPLGDARWRPYAGIGVGGARFQFDDEQGNPHKDHLIGIPIQLGVKYLHRRWFAARFDLTNNIALGNGELNTMNNLSLSAGVEVHFGGRRKSYFPWSPSTSLW